MTSAVDIANNALANIGARSTIASLTEDSNEARAVNLQYPDTLQKLLRAAPWNFARKFINMSLLKALPGTPENTATPADGYWHESYPPPGWLYSYAYPSDALMVRYIMGQGNTQAVGAVPIFPTGNYSPSIMPTVPARFEVMADKDTTGNAIKVVATNASQAIMCYTYYASNPDIWDPFFLSAMQDALAAALSIPLTGKIDLARSLFQQANGTIMEARGQDGNEGYTTYDQMPDWLRARGGNLFNPADGNYNAPWGPLFSLPSIV